ncbi:hypothetical protein H0H92_015253 [Tricholoma furcatifolium]|nr:hypothetical protein H0H92_015253 [Tricholoma furcatifolium]
MPKETDDILDSFPAVLDHDNAARLLSAICPVSIKANVDNDLGSPESFACLLYRNPELLGCVKRALAERNFESVWSLCLSFVERKKIFPSSTKRDPSYFTRMESKLKDLVNGKCKTPLWTLASASDAHPSAMVKHHTLTSLMEETELISMLFYDLGSFKKDQVLNERVEKLFCKGKNTFLVNASGSGKTRLLYEGMTQNWGFYVTSRVEDGEAEALDNALYLTPFSEREMVIDLPKPSSLGYRELIDRNLELLERRFSIVLLTHLLVFKEFLKIARAEGVINDDGLRLRWLLAQIFRPCLDKKRDAHQHLLRTFLGEPSTEITEELRQTCEEIKLLLPDSAKIGGLFIAIDEANVAAKQLWRDNGESHPMIRSLIRTWRDQLTVLDCPITFVVAGTKISFNMFPSTSQEWSSWRWTSDTGSFDSPEAQKQYLLPFLPRPFVETPSGEALLERCWDWCRPRHRLTTSLILMLLEDKVAHPHGVLDLYINKLTSYIPSDAQKFVAEEGLCEVNPFFDGIGELVGDDIRTISIAHEVIFHYIVTGDHPPYYGISKLAIVSSGIGQFKDSNMEVIAMDQPGPTIAAAMYLKDDTKDEHLRSLSGDPYSPTGYIALYLAHAFVKGRALSDVFMIKNSGLRSNSAIAHLVVLQRGKDHTIQEMVVGPSALLPRSQPLGYRASTPDDVIAWLKHERAGAFCLCPSNCQAELIFVLKVNGKYTWVVFRTIGRGKELEPDEMNLEFEHLAENNLFPDPGNHQDLVSDAFKSLPNPLFPAKSLYLRALASFPSEPQLIPKNLTAGSGPVAVLKVDTFVDVTEAFSPNDLIEGLISSMHGKRSSHSDDAFSPIISMKSTKGKRKANPSAEATARPETPIAGSSKIIAREKRVVRPIPRHKTPPSPPQVQSKPSIQTRQRAKVIDAAPPQSNPRGAKKQRGLAPELPAAPLRCSLRLQARESRQKNRGR